jgi:hypothetical protein
MSIDGSRNMPLKVSPLSRLRILEVKTAVQPSYRA